jgi:hypothetical protein
MTEDEVTALATHWIRYWKNQEDSEEREALSWVSEREWDLVRRAPHEAWQLILGVLEQDDSTEIQEVLSAGPLEDLLVYHGEAMIARIEARAIEDQRFARLLGGVWQRDMSEDLWSRVQQAWNRRGWDGNPE